jgi:hypothetical protein
VIFEPEGIIMTDDVNAKITLTSSLPATRSERAMVRDASRSFEIMAPEKMKFELGQPLTITLAFEPIVLLPMVKPLMVIENIDDASIPPPEIVKITEPEEIGLLDRDNDATLLEPAKRKGGADGSKKSSGNLKVIKLQREI